MLSTIEGLITVGVLIGVLVGGVLSNRRTGCLALLIVPIAMICYVSWWQQQNPDALRSTSALDYLFGPLWPSFGAICGFAAARGLREYLTNR